MNINFLKEKFRKIFLREWETLDSVLWFAMGVFAAALILVMFWESATLTIGELLGISDKADMLKFIGLGMGGLLAALGAIAINRRAEAQIQSAEAQKIIAEAQKATAEAQIQTSKFTEQRYIDERYETAIQNLGNDRAGARIATYHSLHRLAKIYEDLREEIFTQLCAHLRQITKDPEYQKNYKNAPSDGVQTILDLLFQIWGDRIFREFNANLRGVYLVGANFSYMHLMRADFTDANLQRGIFKYTYLQGASFTRTQMHAAILNGAQMQKAHMSETVLQFANIRSVNMQNTYLSGTDFRGAYLFLTGMECSSLHSVDFRGARLEEVNMHECRIKNGQFGGCIDVNDSHNSFESRILGRAKCPVDLEGCIIRGDAKRDTVERIVKHIAEISEDGAQKFRAMMEKNIGIPEERLTEEECKRRGGNCEPYAKEEAEQWIAEYKEATDEISEN